MGVIETSAALGACLLVLTVAVALDRRPYRPGKRNYVPIMIVQRVLAWKTHDGERRSSMTQMAVVSISVI